MNEGGAIHAVIDIGTTSVKLLVVHISARGVTRIHEESEQTRLGQGFYTSRVLEKSAIQRTSKAVENAASKARLHQAQSIHTIATSAVREAHNQQELIEAVQASTGLKVRVISGEEEANLVYDGVASAPEYHLRDLLVVDVGGGSSEFILGQGIDRKLRQSFPLGTVRLLDAFPPSDPPSHAELDKVMARVDQLFISEILPVMAPNLGHPNPTKPVLIATGGTATLLAMMHGVTDVFNPQQIEALVLNYADVYERKEKLWAMPVRMRQQIVGLPSSKVDVILMGTAIVEAIMRHLGLLELRVSIGGLRFGLAHRVFEDVYKK